MNFIWYLQYTVLCLYVTIFNELDLYGDLWEDSCLCGQGGGSNISAYY